MKALKIKVVIFLLAIIFFSGFALASEPDSSSNIINLNVSGYPVENDLLKIYAIEALRESFSADKKHQVYINFHKLSGPSELEPGSSTVITAPVKLIDKEGMVETKYYYVAAKNIGLEKIDDSRVLMSNDPEKVDHEGTLFYENLNPDESIRLVYYHKGAPEKRLWLNVSVQNPNTYAIDIFVAKGLGGPTKDGIYAGHVAFKRFLKREKTKSGRIIRIPAQSYTTIATQVLKENEVTTGIIRLRQLSGRNASVRIVAYDKNTDYSSLSSKLKSKEDGRISGAINQGFIDINKEFTCGSGPLDIRIGESPTFISESNGFDIHLGNYGLLHKINIKIKNSSDKARQVSLFYVAAGGPTRGSFIINGEIIETGILDPKKEKSEKVFIISMAPNSVKTLNISMMPQPGSFYPTRFVLLD